jgi:DNA-binding NtrC family response regulator
VDSLEPTPTAPRPVVHGAGCSCDRQVDLTTLPMVGQSPAFALLQDRIGRIAHTEVPVLIEGEPGSGKELAARSIHQLGVRRDKPFVVLHCASIPESQAEAELFGRARANESEPERQGAVARAHGGTLFLDEIDALGPHAQMALLRFLQSRTFRRAGADREQFSDVRLIAAANRPLKTLVDAGVFRSDLLYRLNILGLRVPALRERPGDASLLAQHFVERMCAHFGIEPKTLPHESLEWIEEQRWPGNVRELENFLQTRVLGPDGPELVLGDLRADPLESGLDFQGAKARAIADFERDFLSKLLSRTGGNVSEAARLARKERRALGKLIKKHGIDRRQFGT